jgi:hypothetical protein
MQEVARQRIPIMQHVTSECEVQDANVVKPCIERRVHDENEVSTALNASQLFRKKIVEMRRPLNFFAAVFSVRLASSCLNLFLCESRSRECNYIQVESHREVGNRSAIVGAKRHTFKGRHSDNNFSKTGESAEKARFSNFGCDKSEALTEAFLPF